MGLETAPTYLWESTSCKNNYRGILRCHGTLNSSFMKTSHIRGPFLYHCWSACAPQKWSMLHEKSMKGYVKVTSGIGPYRTKFCDKGTTGHYVARCYEHGQEMWPMLVTFEHAAIAGCITDSNHNAVAFAQWGMDILDHFLKLQGNRSFCLWL